MYIVLLFLSHIMYTEDIVLVFIGFTVFCLIVGFVPHSNSQNYSLIYCYCLNISYV